MSGKVKSGGVSVMQAGLAKQFLECADHIRYTLTFGFFRLFMYHYHMN